MKYPDSIENVIKNFCARKKAAVKTTTELDKRIINASLLAQEKLKQTQSAIPQPNLWRIIMKSHVTKLAAAAVIIIVIMLGINYLDTPIDGASAVFAAAMDKVEQARTFSCTSIFDMTYKDGGKRGKYLMKQKRMFKEPDRERHEKLTSAPPWPQYIGEVTIQHYGKRQRLQFRPFDKTAEFHDMSSDYDIDDKTGELKLTQLNTSLRDRLLKLSAGAVEDLGRVELDGKSVRLLQSRKDKRITTVWVNPETNYPVQIEHKWTDQSRSPVMYSSIQIDTELDDNLFSLEPPEGYTLSVNEPGWPDDKRKISTKVMHLGLWCWSYANDNDDQFPDDLADIVKAGVITDKVLNRVLASPDDPDGPPVIRYRKPNKDAKDRSNEVMLYEIYDQWPKDGVVACFGDGHSEIIADQNRFEELIK
ncbi:MAG: LolA family protein [Planctomycetota bacterium]|jgi:outer membrane lipoprotein-sorting protein